jgi:hypothetical protein
MSSIYQIASRYEAFAGEDIETCISSMFDMAESTKTPCCTVFNGIELTVSPGAGVRSSVIKQVTAEYYRKCAEKGLKFDTDKLRYDLVPMDALDEIVKRFTYGARKYAPENWKSVEDAVERYCAALMRHFSAYRQGERIDPEAPGLSHIGAAAWNALVLIWFDLRGFRPGGGTVRDDSGHFDSEAS